MKKIISLALVVAMVMACAVAFAADYTVPSSSKDLEGAPEFETPISLKTKKSGTNITVTFGDEVDSAEVVWLGKKDTNEALEIVDGKATFSLSGHKYQPGVSGASRDNTLEQETILGGLLPVVTVDGKDYFLGLVEAQGKFARYLDQNFFYDHWYYHICDEDGKDVTSAALARKILVEAGYQTQYQEWSTISLDVKDATPRNWAFYVERVYDKGEKVFGWKVEQTYGTWVDGAAYIVKYGDKEVTYDRSGAWLTETITVENSDVFGMGLEGSVAKYTYKKLGNQTTHDWRKATPTTYYTHLESNYLWQIREEYAEGEIAAITAEYLPNAGRTRLHIDIEKREAE